MPFKGHNGVPITNDHCVRRRTHSEHSSGEEETQSAGHATSSGATSPASFRRHSSDSRHEEGLWPDSRVRLPSTNYCTRVQERRQDARLLTPRVDRGLGELQITLPPRYHHTHE